MKKQLKIITDVLMLIIFLYLMSYRISHTPRRHALFGVILFALFLLHHLLNTGYYKSLFKGRYTRRRIILLGTDLLLFIAMVMIAISSIMLSGMVIDSPIPINFAFHTVHTASTAWCFVLMAIHLSLHLNSAYLKAERRLKTRQAKLLWKLFCIIILIAGIMAFVTSTLPTSLFMPDMSSDITVTLPVFYIQYLLMIAGCSMITHLLLLLDIRRKVPSR